MKVKLTKLDPHVIPDIELFDEEIGKRVQNRDLPKADRVEADITFADDEEKLYYLGDETELKFGEKGPDGKKKKARSISRRDWKLEECIRKHVKNISGCLREYYRDGNTLWEGPASTEKSDLITDLFLRINGVRLDDEPFEDDGAGELSEGESGASA